MLATYHGNLCAFGTKFTERLSIPRIDAESMKITEDWYINYILLRRSQKVVYDDICKYHWQVMHGK